MSRCSRTLPGILQESNWASSCITARTIAADVTFVSEAADQASSMQNGIVPVISKPRRR
jgi:hypothetical protein